MEPEGPHQVLALTARDLSLAEKLDSLPTRPGVYLFRSSDGTTIYVGKASNLRNRVRQYFHKSRALGPRIEAMVSKIGDVELIVTDSEVEALILESNLIKQFHPRYNVVLKDDKGYPYIVITNEPFPRVFVTRRRIPGAGRYFGPYTDVTTMRMALKTVRDIFSVRSCNYDLRDDSIARKKFKVCLDYHIRKCEGPCEGIVSQEHYVGQIAHVARVLSGRTRGVAQSLRHDMQRASEEMRFEDAARVRDRIRALDVYLETQKVLDDSGEDRDIVALTVRNDDGCGVIFRVREGKLIGSRHFYLSQTEAHEEGELVETLLQRVYEEETDIPPVIVVSAAVPSPEALDRWLTERAGLPVRLVLPEEGTLLTQVKMARANAQFWLDELEVQRLKRGDSVPRPVEALQKDLLLPAPPRRIECFDISNTQGQDSVASLVVFVDGKPRRSEYRTFRIRTVEGPNDFASMQEVVRRRYERVLREQGPMPDLVMVDGGKGQLSSAVEILKDLHLHSLRIIGLAKRLEEVFVPEHTEPILLPKTSPGLRLLQQVRDEAHRFAVTYHRNVRSKRILQTELDLVKGIGKRRAAELLEAFGSVQGVRFATGEQLAEIVGEKTATKILEHFAQATEDQTSGDPLASV